MGSIVPNYASQECVMGYTYYGAVRLGDMDITPGTGVYLTPFPKHVGEAMDIAVAITFRDEGELNIQGMGHWVYVRWMFRPCQILNDSGYECTEDMFGANEILCTKYFDWVTLDTIEG